MKTPPPSLSLPFFFSFSFFTLIGFKKQNNINLAKENRLEVNLRKEQHTIFLTKKIYFSMVGLKTWYESNIVIFLVK